MKLGVMGVGYVGLITAVCFADKGYDVYVHDIAKEKIATLQSGGLPIFEEGLSQLFALNKHRLHFIHEASFIAVECDILFICVGTPQDDTGKANLTYVREVVELIGRESQSDKIIIIKSTVPPGTTEKMEQLANKKASPSVEIRFVHNPEFLRQGKAVYDFMNPERIVIGSSHVSAIKVVKELYKSWDVSVIETDCKSAELLKYTANSFLAMKISFINMISQLSDQLKTNIDDIAYGIGLDQRIGGEFLKAGIGFGGSCFPKDLNAINHVASEVGIRLPLIEDTAAINDEQGMLFFEKMRSYFDGAGLAGKKIALLGLSFKPFTDDTRSSPAIGLAKSLLKERAFLSAYDPLVKDFPIQDVSVLSSLNEALDQTDIAVIVTDWPEFKSLLMAENLKKMKQAVIFDGRNMFTLEEIRKVSDQKPLHYVSIGRPIVSTLHENKWEMISNQAII